MLHIYDIKKTIREDVTTLTEYVKGRLHANLSDSPSKDQQQRVHDAALRMIAVIGMTFSILWSFSALTYLITLPAKIILNLASLVGSYVLMQDLFYFSRNAKEGGFLEKQNAWQLAKAFNTLSKDDALKLTQDMTFKALWMSFNTRKA